MSALLHCLYWQHSSCSHLPPFVMGEWISVVFVAGRADLQPTLLPFLSAPSHKALLLHTTPAANIPKVIRSAVT